MADEKHIWLLTHSIKKSDNKISNHKNGRLLLRQFVDSDLEHVFKGLSYPVIIKYYTKLKRMYSHYDGTQDVNDSKPGG